MDVVVVRDATELARVGEELVAGWLGPRPTGTLMPALGVTPLGIYARLARRRASRALDTSGLRVIQLDAYLNLSPDDSRSLYGWLRGAVLEPLGIPDERVVRLAGDAQDPGLACRAFDSAVAAAGGVDVAVLGLGPNGHLGFNEPPSDPTSPTRVVQLSEASLDNNARYWGGRAAVPGRALTAGMPIILSARRIVLVVAGAHKRDILARVLDGPLTPDVPASYLRTVAAATVIADEAALPGGERLPARESHAAGG